eukprot:13877363-Alexandrium_andersonii.AAC.1
MAGFSCAHVVLARSLASPGVRGSLTYSISVSSSESGLPEGCVSYLLSGMFRTPCSVRYVFGMLGPELPPPMVKFCGPAL